MAAVRPPRGLPTNKEFLRFSTTRFISRSLMLLSMGTAPSEQKVFSSVHCPRAGGGGGGVGRECGEGRCGGWDVVEGGEV